MLGRILFVLQLVELLKGPGGLDALGRLPAGQGVREIDADTLAGLQGEGRPLGLQHQPQLQVRHHKGRGHDFKAEHTVHGRLFQVGRHQRVAALVAQRGRNAVQHFDQVRTRATTRVQNDDVGISQPVGQVQFLAQDLVHPRDLIFNDFGWSIPDAQGLA